jgi:hypothetical protein
MSAVRDSMKPLINRLRELIADDAGQAQTFSDQQLQDTLDERREFVRYAPLELSMTRTPSTGGLLYTDYYAGMGAWEGVFTPGTPPSLTSDTDTYLVGPSYAILSPASADYISGHFTFAVDGGHPFGQVPPVFIVGNRYDMYRAAATMLRKWAAKLKLKFDVTTKEQSMMRSQQIEQCLDMAREYDAKSWPISVQSYRSDLNTGDVTGAPYTDGTKPWW